MAKEIGHSSVEKKKKKKTEDSLSISLIHKYWNLSVNANTVNLHVQMWTIAHAMRSHLIILSGYISF